MPSAIIEELDLEKPSFRPSKWPRKLKLLKIVNCQNCQKTVLSQLEKVGGHRYPSGSRVSHGQGCVPWQHNCCLLKVNVANLLCALVKESLVKGLEQFLTQSLHHFVVDKIHRLKLRMLENMPLLLL
jgi:hypothetical protein